MRTEKSPPACLPQVVENAGPDGKVITPGVIEPCIFDCPHRAEAVPLGDITPERLKELEAKNKRGDFMNCERRRRLAGL